MQIVFEPEDHGEAASGGDTREQEFCVELANLIFNGDEKWWFHNVLCGVTQRRAGYHGASPTLGFRIIYAWSFERDCAALAAVAPGTIVTASIDQSAIAVSAADGARVSG